MNPLIKSTTLVSSIALSCSAAFAAETLKATVVEVDNGAVALEVEGKAPAWLREGGSVQAFGWPTKVVSVNGSVVVLQTTASRTANVQAGSELVVLEISEQPRFGC